MLSVEVTGEDTAASLSRDCCGGGAIVGGDGRLLLAVTSSEGSDTGTSLAALEAIGIAGWIVGEI